jgi:hypothetical protein
MRTAGWYSRQSSKSIYWAPVFFDLEEYCWLDIWFDTKEQCDKYIKENILPNSQESIETADEN